MLAVAAACGGDRGAPTIPREKFVAANLALRAIPDTAHDRDSLRTAALRRLRVSEKDLRAYLQRHERNTALVASLWAEIADSLHRRDSIAAASAAKPPAPAPDSATVPGTPGQPQPAAGQTPPPPAAPATQVQAMPGAPELPPGVPMPEIPSRASPRPAPSRPPSTQLEPPHTAAPVRVAPPRPRVKHLPDTAGRNRAQPNGSP
jgi:hypothetical protein